MARSCYYSSTHVRWRPSLSASIVTELVTQFRQPPASRPQHRGAGSRRAASVYERVFELSRAVRLPRTISLGMSAGNGVTSIAAGWRHLGLPVSDRQVPRWTRPIGHVTGTWTRTLVNGQVEVALAHFP
jgi:hypothetical protein